MEVLTVAFCDDDARTRTHIQTRVCELFSSHGFSIAAMEYSSAKELSAAMAHIPFELIFLDIDMPGLDGIEFGEQLRTHGCHTDIIYISNMEDRVYEVFRANPWSFIRKKYFDAEIARIIESYIHALRRRTVQIILQDTDGNTQALRPDAVMYAESFGKLQKIYSAQDLPPFLVRCSLHELEESLSSLGFIRTHKGFLVNYRFIRKITSRGIVLENGQSLPIGRDRLQPTRERYLSLMKWKGSAPTSE